MNKKNNEYKLIKEGLNELDEMVKNIKRMRENIKEIEGPNGLAALEKKYIEKNEIITKRIKEYRKKELNIQ